ncbi:MAG: hypothetical protein AB2L07_08465 [Thermoanaerobaculaceae bacterium]
MPLASSLTQATTQRPPPYATRAAKPLVPAALTVMTLPSGVPVFENLLRRIAPVSPVPKSVQATKY